MLFGNCYSNFNISDWKQARDLLPQREFTEFKAKTSYYKILTTVYQKSQAPISYYLQLLLTNAKCRELNSVTADPTNKMAASQQQVRKSKQKQLEQWPD